MEQGPDELADEPEERAEDLDRLTDKPMEPADDSDYSLKADGADPEGASGGVNDD